MSILQAGPAFSGVKNCEGLKYLKITNDMGTGLGLLNDLLK